jgi:putative ABC transport system substrate-binding protein
MRRREFIIALGSTTLALPLAARAQPGKGLRRICILILTSPDDSERMSQIAAFETALRDLGWQEGRNIIIDRRLPADDPDRLRIFAAEAVAANPEVVVVSGPTPLLAIQRLSTKIPIVFTAVDDPVGSGLVATLAHPGGNVTGFTPAEFSVGGKMVERLKEVAPDIVNMGVLLDPNLSSHAGMWRSMLAAAPLLGVQIQQLPSADRAAIGEAIETFSSSPRTGLIVPADRVTNTNREAIIALAAQHRLPAIYPYPHFAREGGLLSYGADISDLFRRAASYVDRILKGERPGDLPVQQPTKYKLVINLKVAKSLDLGVPTGLLVGADEVIE